MRKVWIYLLLFSYILFLTACTKEDSANQPITLNESTAITDPVNGITDRGPEKGGTIKLFTTRPDTLNPITTTNVYVQDFSPLIFDSMFQLGKDQSVIPSLCDKWEVSPDGLIWTFHMRDQVFWHNQTPFTADDVKFTFDMIKNSNVQSIYKNHLENIAMYMATDSRIFKVILKKPDSYTPERLVFPILCQSYYTVQDFLNRDPQKSLSPMGTGPYEFVATSNMDILRLKANNQWWYKDNNAAQKLEIPYVSDIEIKIYRSGLEMTGAFQTRDVDAAILPISDFSKYNGRNDLTIRKFISKNYEFMAYNLGSPILGDKSVRQAIAYAIDKVKLINDVIPGEAVASDTPILPDSWLNSTNILYYTQSESKVRETLTNGGWKEEQSGDTVSYYKSIKGVKTKLKVDLMVNEFNENRLKIAEYISQKLSAVGIETKVSKTSREAESKAVDTRKFDMVLMGYRISSIPDISFAYASSEILSGLNVSGYGNPTVDKILENLKSENDVNRKKALMADLKGILNDEVPFMGLFFYNHAVLYSTKIRGELNPMVWDKLNDITRWYIPKKT